ncbi:hypothetical protein E2C01_022955 [Portunus trituberculatus]|uniref:Uncharacterized protein n=1 Tax=Portunus trituberculatus TaxID=210409 RepID=A0A5B7E8G9_PORTR|nr:hypothetical protein [Portunus trituberculatus]
MLQVKNGTQHTRKAPVEEENNITRSQDRKKETQFLPEVDVSVDVTCLLTSVMLPDTNMADLDKIFPGGGVSLLPALFQVF